MSHQVLARKWRPRNFAQLVGQEHVVRALGNALDHDRLHHAFLFTGTRGVGKTTLSRILAKSLNCQRGVSSTPCGECTACREIDEGRFVDLIEVDAASRTKVEDTRELLENVQYAPTLGRYKVYLIDEVHMLSAHSFNALLKTLEEPPPHVKFLLATTDPQKLPVTVLSRCLQFSLKRLPSPAIARHLAYILGEEGISAEVAALDLIARAGDGSMRDALSLLDQAIAFGNGRVLAADTAAMLGTIDRRHVLHLAAALADGEAEALFAAIEQLDRQAPDYGAVLADLLALWQRVAVVQLVPGAPLDEHFDAEVVAGLAARMSPEDVQLYYQIGLHARRDLPLAPDPRGGFEMGLLRMLCFRPATEAAPVRRDETPPPGAGAPPGPTGGRRRGAAALSAALGGRSESATVVAAERSTPATERIVAVPRPDTRVPAGEPQAPTQGKEVVACTEAAPPPAPPVAVEPSVAGGGPRAPAPSTPAAAAVDWEALLAVLDLRGLTLELARHCSWGHRDGARVTLWLDPAMARARTPQAEERLEAALARHFGTSLRLQIDTSAAPLRTPAAEARRRADERQSAAERAFRDDPMVRTLLSTFEAKLRPGSITPLDSEPVPVAIPSDSVSEE
ncbi:DNA polymerase III gamma subunit /DNA polymerase III tau subunit [Plasticicumulans lactativorans]|uniref:DNA polymerase III subunit gamma/tau n=1 Tax=Plasticicumulans lactativorans TaxID=1133106 RepID=A0A4V2SD87_9GAMM|nr:DNA polymerase III subunit gamma/tau [Plasticicumulans lactativorans]TCO82310.1 DNA polymerase III gamma subunit /DNA polymerase III tau subunit [Plasticicumulans lactativorans]